ncbi:MAG: ATP-binding protein [Chloroflexota bacterium]
MKDSDPENSMVVHLTDVTQQMTLQRDIRSFHIMVSHKLRTPLISMFASMELLLDHAHKLPIDEIVKLAQTAYKGMKRLRSQIADILQYANTRSLASGHQALTLPQLEATINKLSDVLELETIDMIYSPMLRDASIKFSQQSVELVFSEILENSKKFHPDKTPKIDITLTPINENTLTIAMADNGVHLSPEQLDQAWMPYYQAEKQFTGEIEGMGLGLSVAAQMIWEAGGTYRIHNREDKPGVVVEITLGYEKI